MRRRSAAAASRSRASCLDQPVGAVLEPAGGARRERMLRPSAHVAVNRIAGAVRSVTVASSVRMALSGRAASVIDADHTLPAARVGAQ